MAGAPDKAESPRDFYYQQVVSRLVGAGADLLGAPVMLVIISAAAILTTVFLALRSPELLRPNIT